MVGVLDGKAGGAGERSPVDEGQPAVDRGHGRDDQAASALDDQVPSIIDRKSREDEITADPQGPSIQGERSKDGAAVDPIRGPGIDTKAVGGSAVTAATGCGCDRGCRAL